MPSTLVSRILTLAERSLRAIRQALAQLRQTSVEAPDVSEHALPRVPRVGPPSLGTEEPDAAAVPAHYGDDRLLLLARDPTCLFVDWDLAPGRRRMDLHAIVRVYDASGIEFEQEEKVWHRDVEVTSDAGSAYVHVERPATRYVAEIGLLRDDGAFFVLTRSNVVWTPRAERPGDDPARWVTVRWEGEPHQVGGESPTHLPSPPPARRHAVGDASSR